VNGPRLSLRQRFKPWRHDARAALGVGDAKPLRLENVDGFTTVVAGGERLAIAAPERWTFYRQGGVAGRALRLAREYGVDVEVDVAPGDLVVDVGANVGEFAREMLRRGARVVAIEGDPDVAACLRRNLQGCEGASVVECVLWFEAAELTFNAQPTTADSSLFSPDEGVGRAVAVSARTLDDVLADLDVGPVALLKCDVEGAEPEVLRGAANTLNDTRAVLVDTGAEREGETTDAACEALLRAAGFDVSTGARTGRQITVARARRSTRRQAGRG